MSSQRKKSRRQPEPGSGGGRGPGRRRSKSADPLPVSSEVRTPPVQHSRNTVFDFKEKNSDKGGNSNNEKLLVSTQY